MSYSYYKANKKRAVFKNTEPTLTDQSQAQNTDINIIIKRIRATGMAPQPGTAQAMSGDFTLLPGTLRDLLELARSANQRRAELPKQLRDMPLEQLLSLTANDVTRILTPPVTPEVKKEDEKK